MTTRADDGQFAEERASEHSTLPPLTQRLPALDGIRGLAIVLILALHFFDVAVPFASKAVSVFKTWGWVGVELFFVLSGFLITTILVTSKGRPRYFRNFYARRALRILPVYYATLALMLLILPAFFRNFEQALGHPVYGPAWIYWTHTSNFYFAAHAFADGPLGHTWSLAVEEQFYFVWPVLAWLLTQRSLRRLCVLVLIAEPLLRAALLLMGMQPISVYYLTFTRLDGLLLGAFVALAMNDPALRSVLVHNAGRVIAAVLLLLAFAIAMKKLSGFAALVTLESAKYTLVSLASGAVLVLALSAPARSLLRLMLESSALTFFGRYSYGLYLLHLPVISLLGTRMLSQPKQQLWLTFGSYLAITVALSLLSWHLMEKPLLRLKARFATS